MNTRTPRLHIHWRREVILPALAMAEVTLIAPWLLLLILPARHIPPERAISLCLLLLLGTLYLTRAMDALRIPLLIHRLIFLALLAGASIMSLRLAVFNEPQWSEWQWLREPLKHLDVLLRWLPEEVIAVLGAAWLCWRGLRLASKPPSVYQVIGGLQLGLAVLALFVTMSTERDITLYLPVYFFCQLLAIGLTRVETVEQERGGRRSPFNAWWIAALVGATGIVVLAAGLVSALVLGVGTERLWLWLWPALRLLALPVMLIIAPVLALMGMLVELIVQPLVNWMAEFSLRLSGQLENMEPGQTPPAVEFVMRLFEYGANTAVVLSVLAVLLSIAWAVQRRAAGQDHDDDTRESAWSAQALLGKLRAQWQHRLAQLQNLVNVTGRLGASGLWAALTIRRLYAQTVRLAAQRGYPRAPARTPYEHQSTLEQAFPGCASELAQITEAYVGVHYGEVPEQPQALAALKGAFERVKASEQRAA